MDALDDIAYVNTANTKVRKSYSYRPNRVKAALDWLKVNNPFYKNVKIEYPENWTFNTDDDFNENEEFEVPMRSCTMSTDFEENIRKTIDVLNDTGFQH